MKKAKRGARTALLEQAHSFESPLFRAEDFPAAHSATISRALARLAKNGIVRRMAKGLYYIPKPTLLGESHPADLDLFQKKMQGRFRLTGVTAANRLGLSTQLPSRPEMVAYGRTDDALSAHIKIKHRQGCQGNLTPLEGAILEVLRDGGAYLEASPSQAALRLTSLLRDEIPAARLTRLRDIALQDPPRVRAILGALLQSVGYPKALWIPLRHSLNPLSRFDFGVFGELANAKVWQSK